MTAELAPPSGRASRNPERGLYFSRVKSDRGNRGVKTEVFNLKDPSIEGRMGRESKALHRLHHWLERRHDWQVAQCVQDHEC